MPRPRHPCSSRSSAIAAPLPSAGRPTGACSRGLAGQPRRAASPLRRRIGGALRTRTGAAGRRDGGASSSSASAARRPHRHRPARRRSARHRPRRALLVRDVLDVRARLRSRPDVLVVLVVVSTSSRDRRRPSPPTVFPTPPTVSPTRHRSSPDDSPTVFPPASVSVPDPAHHPLGEVLDLPRRDRDGRTLPRVQQPAAELVGQPGSAPATDPTASCPARAADQALPPAGPPPCPPASWRASSSSSAPGSSRLPHPGPPALHTSLDLPFSLASRVRHRPSPAIIDPHGLDGQYPTRVKHTRSPSPQGGRPAATLSWAGQGRAGGRPGCAAQEFAPTWQHDAGRGSGTGRGGDRQALRARRTWRRRSHTRV